MSGDGNPYAVASVPAAAAPAEEAIRRMANRSVIFAAVAWLVVPFAAPGAVFFGHRALLDIKRSGVGLEHRGAAMAGVVLGWMWMPVFVFAALMLVR